MLVASEEAQSGKLKESIEHLNEAIRKQPEDGFLYRLRGHSFKMLGMSDKASRDYEKSRALGYVPTN